MPNLTRLKTLSNHMMSENRLHKFDFNTIIHSDPYQPECGTSGCMIGEFPQAFPQHWKFLDKMDGVCRADIEDNPVSDIENFFEISTPEYSHLFEMQSQSNEFRHDSTAEQLDENASLHAVVKNLDSFILKHDPSYLGTFLSRWTDAFDPSGEIDAA